MTYDSAPHSSDYARPDGGASQRRAVAAAEERAPRARQIAPAEPNEPNLPGVSGTSAAACPLPAVRSRLLVIGYGNTLFADDGVGPLIAAQVADWCLPGVLALERHELMPELAADLAMTQEAIFIDATLTDKRVSLTRLELGPEPLTALGHALTPRGLLELARVTFGHAPPAWLLAVPGSDFGLGRTVSDHARAGMAEALTLLRERI